jgi:5-bromo-4-chloroindolyl phosphate hydrolysis protein
LRKELKVVPYTISREYLNNIQLYFQKPKIFKAKLYAEAESFFEIVEKSNKDIDSKIICPDWSENSKHIFLNILNESKSLYKLDDNKYKNILNGIDFIDTLCRG